jgi:transcriptional regulator with XRE-family HTH domain
MNAASQFGSRLRSVRKAHKLKIGQLADRVDIGVKHLGRLERGEKHPSFELIVALARAMNVSPATFFEFDTGQTDPQILRKQLNHLLTERDAKELRQALRLLGVFFGS